MHVMLCVYCLHNFHLVIALVASEFFDIYPLFQDNYMERTTDIADKSGLWHVS